MSKKCKTSELGIYKENITMALFKDKDICDLLLGDTSGMDVPTLREEFRKHVKSHLFIDDTITEAESFIFYEVRCPYMHTQTKSCEIVLFAICHRDILDNYVKDGYHGNRADILSQMVENVLINDEETANKFGIGKLTLDSIDFYNSTRFYGRILTFRTPDFR